ncbi:MAG: NTP transferase domain-containing protein, partial [Firmicutes bacterium]|nr:NTP transferase domain-containing protein [Bacillota bacterium]
MGNRPLKAVILAAGAGKRMRADGSELPKVMRLANGVPLLGYVLCALDFIPAEDTILIVGYRREAVCAAFPRYPTALQTEQLGTGHAAQIAMAALPEFDGDLLICCGDMPLMRRETYLALTETHQTEKNACTLLSGATPYALPYGRVLRDENGVFTGIVEEKDATERQRA